MIDSMEKKIIVDLDGTISLDSENGYYEAKPNVALIQKLRNYRDNGFSITVFTARNMRTFNGNVGKINVHTLPVIMDWLNKHDVPFDEVLVGKPWCGFDGFYVDDRALRPSEFVEMTFEEIKLLLSEPPCLNDEISNK